MPTPSAAALKELAQGPCYPFAEWPNPNLPRVAAGVYTVWLGDRLIYVGMSGHGLTAEQIEQHKTQGRGPKGLSDRIRSHRSGRRGSDQFCLYLFDRFVLPELTPEEIAQARSGQLSLDARTRTFILERLSYRFTETPDGATALELERRVRRGVLAAGRPLLNPLD